MTERGEVAMYVVNTKGSLVHFIAGLFVVGSLLLGYFVSPYWFLFTGWIGIMLMISSLTGFCPMEWILKALGVEQRRVIRLDAGKK